MPTLPLTLAVITHNEADNIARCLDSVPFAAEKLVIDSGKQKSRLSELLGRVSTLQELQTAAVPDCTTIDASIVAMDDRERRIKSLNRLLTKYDNIKSMSGVSMTKLKEVESKLATMKEVCPTCGQLIGAGNVA